MSNSPAFQYYPADLISDPKVMFWDMEAVGCYWQMITFLWLNGGKFEFNSRNLATLFRVKRELTAVKLWNKISNKFQLDNGIVTHRRVLKEMQRQEESRVRRSEAGKHGAEKRWKDNSNANSKATKKTMAKNSSSSSSSTSVNNTTTTITGAGQNFSDADIEKIIAAWNEISKKKIVGAEVLAVKLEVSKLLADATNTITLETIFAAVSNYGKALALPESQAGWFTLCNFLRRAIRNYLPGYFDIDNYDKSKFKENTNGNNQQARKYRNDTEYKSAENHPECITL